jgi:hypothetical protein
MLTPARRSASQQTPSTPFPRLANEAITHAAHIFLLNETALSGLGGDKTPRHRRCAADGGQLVLAGSSGGQGECAAAGL